MFLFLKTPNDSEKSSQILIQCVDQNFVSCGHPAIRHRMAINSFGLRFSKKGQAHFFTHILLQNQMSSKSQQLLQAIFVSMSTGRGKLCVLHSMSDLILLALQCFNVVFKTQSIRFHFCLTRKWSHRQFWLFPFTMHLRNCEALEAPQLSQFVSFLSQFCILLVRRNANQKRFILHFCQPLLRNIFECFGATGHAAFFDFVGEQL